MELKIFMEYMQLTNFKGKIKDIENELKEYKKFVHLQRRMITEFR
ncbi:hypothetical protein ACRTAI_003000 [Clostridium perfringens]